MFPKPRQCKKDIRRLVASRTPEFQAAGISELVSRQQKRADCDLAVQKAMNHSKPCVIIYRGFSFSNTWASKAWQQLYKKRHLCIQEYTEF